MSAFYNNALVGASGQGEYTIEESLRFNASQSSYLSRLQGSATSTTTGTWSGWCKRGKLGAVQHIWSSSNYDFLQFNSDDTIRVAYLNNAGYVSTTAVYRDPSAWYHIFLVFDTTNATAVDRMRLYVNGVQQTLSWGATPQTQNATFQRWNVSGYTGDIGDFQFNHTNFFDGYMAECYWIDGQALDPSSFGEFDSVTGVWKPAKYTGNYGTNGFYLPMQLDNTVEGFNTVTYLGTGSTQKISGVGFSPDLVWIKNRNIAGQWHVLHDSVRGAGKRISSNDTYQEVTENALASFDTDGFTVTTGDNGYNGSSGSYVAWCWDAGSSTVSNTDGSITSSVRANLAYGFSVVTYTGTGANATVGHGLGVAPSMIIVKNRSAAASWMVYHTSIGNTGAVFLNITNATITSSTYFNNTTPTSDVFSIGDATACNGSGNSIVAYCFSEVAGYSKFGAYTGTGASGNTVTTGFKPAFVMVKRTDSTGNWFMFDSTRDAGSTGGNTLWANYSNAEDNGGSPLYPIEYTDTGFVIQNGSDPNVSGGTYIYMAFADTREYAYWLDDSGNNNDWQPNGGITTESTVTDTPTPYADGGNYAVLNPLWGNSNPPAFSNTNLVLSPSGSGYNNAISTIAMPATGYWYAEFTATANVPYGGGNNNSIGVVSTTRGTLSGSNYIGQYSDTYGYFDGGGLYNNGSLSQTVASYATNDVIMVAFGDGKLWWGKNGTWQGTGSPNPATATSPAYSGLSGDYFFGAMTYNSPYGGTWSANFGQRPFAYTPPTGFLPLHTGNLPDSAIVDGGEYFNAVTYTGNGTGQSITGVGFQPSWVWGKSRNTANSHSLYDAVRGTGLELFTDTTDAEVDRGTSSGVQSFDSDGFTLNGAGNLNTNTNSYVAWNWKANGAGVSNTDGSITSTVSANPTSGFSIVTYTGTGANATVGHGLGVAPQMVIVKNRGGSYSWLVYHKFMAASSPATWYMSLNQTSAASNGANVWINDPTSTVFTVSGTYPEVNGSANNYVAYCFADVEGYSKFGSYTGNGSSDGPFVYTGFRPVFVMIKYSSGVDNWAIFDTSRLGYNADNNELQANTSSAEGTAGFIDILSNGFKNRNSDSRCNTNGGTYIYAAFAENPFKNSLAR